MTTTQIKPLSLESFLQQSYIDESPAWEYIDGEIRQKPMPQGQHSKLQYKLCETINQITEPATIAYALPELRCTFGGRSIVPNISVFLWDRIPLTPEEEIANQFDSFPDWTIEILSPNQKPTKVIDNILHCLEFGCQLGWLIDPDERSIFVFKPNQALKNYKIDSADKLPILESIDLNLTVSQIFSWLKQRALKDPLKVISPSQP
jgi:Uma2 family endonuclease